MIFVYFFSNLSTNKNKNIYLCIIILAHTINHGRHKKTYFIIIIHFIYLHLTKRMLEELFFILINQECFVAENKEKINNILKLNELF